MAGNSHSVAEILEKDEGKSDCSLFSKVVKLIVTLFGIPDYR